MKKIINKVKDDLFVYNFLFLLLFLVISFVLYLFNLRFRLWFIILIIIIFLVCFIVSLIQIFLKESMIIKVICLSLVTIFVICIFVFYDFWLLLFGWILNPEYVTEVDGQKYVGCVKNGLDYTEVSYYDYYGLFVETKERIRGDFGSGSFNPFKDTDKISDVYYTFYDKDGKVIYEKVKSYAKDKDGNIKLVIEQVMNLDVNTLEEDNILYEIKFGKTVIRVKKTSNVLGQRMTVGVYKSSNGKDFKLMTKDDIIVSLEAKFVFLDENTGFIVSTGDVWLNRDSNDLYVTKDGGKTFEVANFDYQNDDVEYMEIIDYPYFEDEILNLDCEIYRNGYENKKLHFESKDGVNWKLKQENKSRFSVICFPAGKQIGFEM